MSEVWKGETVVDKGETLTWNRTTGWATGRVWEGKKDELMVMVAALQQAYDTIKLDRVGDSPVWRCEASVGNTDSGDGGQDNPVDTHDLLGNDLQQSSLINPVLTGTLDGSSPGTVIRAVKLAFSDFTAGRKTYAELTGDITTACNTAGISNGDALEAFDDLIAGRDSFVTSQYVYRRTRTISSRNTSLKAVFTNVNRIFTTAEVETAEEIPESANFTLPAGEWLKKSPTINAQFGSKTQITYEYWHADEWSRLYYAAKA